MSETARCRWLGEPTGQVVRVRCPQQGDATRVLAAVSRCRCPELRDAAGRCGACLPDWPGPWLPRQRGLAEALALCATCPHRAVNS